MKPWMVVIFLMASTAMAQDDAVATARRLAQSGARTQAIAILEQRLALTPDDTDARILYGTVLSWNRDFDRARLELQTVLKQQPQNRDARLALVRVELWSAHAREAERLAGESLALYPNDAELLTLRNQARSRDDQSLVSIGANYDGYEGLDAWKEAFVEVKRGFRPGAVVARAAHARRFGSDDDQVEIRFYPLLGRSSYAELAVAWAPDAVLYPETRLNAELYRTLSRGFEASAGVSHLEFRELEATNVYTGSLGRYAGNWFFAGRVYVSTADTASQVLVRRFFGEDGQYVGLRLGEGTTRDGIRSAADIESLQVREIAAEALLAPGRRWTVKLRAGVGSTSTSKNRFSMSAAIGRRF